MKLRYISEYFVLFTKYDRNQRALQQASYI